jgi:hypothetical protein
VIELAPGGKVNVRNLHLIVEYGTITLRPEEPDNPELNIRTFFRDIEGATIYVDVVGPLESVLTGGIQVSSDAGLTEEEIYQRLAGGPSDSESGELTVSTRDLFQEELGQFVGGVGLAKGADFVERVEVRVTTGGDRFIGTYRWSERVTLEAQYNNRADTNSGITGTQSSVLGAINYQMSKSWLLRTELAPSGGSVDVLWQHRY